MGKREFKTGATRDVSEGKMELVGYYSPLVIKRFGQYMLKHQIANNRAAKNWQKGIPKDSYIDSMFRHFVDLHLEHDGYPSRDGIEDALCAIIFNAQGYLFEILKEQHGNQKKS